MVWGEGRGGGGGGGGWAVINVVLMFNSFLLVERI
jgi:hypothetical protein